jgi:tetratricopeptide (TPR) repeat protein
MSTLPDPATYPYTLGPFTRKITTSSAAAQTWFSRGLTWVYTFNHAEAATCFENAIAHDPSCAIAHWGLAYALGPNYNYAWEFFGENLADALSRTHEAARRARELAETEEDVTAVEKALIEAIQARFPSGEFVVSENMEVYMARNRAYADAMEKVYETFGETDLDVAALYADSIMSLTPWKLWDLKTGLPNPGTRTLDAKRVLETALTHNDAKGHPGILHYYIHLIEMSPTPELGLVPADHLRELVPDSGHANHMPSHLDVLVGDYRAAIRANQRATTADEKYLQRAGAMNFYSNYRMHNYHTLIYAAMFAGQKNVALETVDRMEATLPTELLLAMADFVEVFFSVRPHVMVRFGMWEELKALAVPADERLYCVTTAATYYAKGIAYAATGEIVEAERYRELYAEAVKNVPETRLDFPNRCIDILGVGAAMLDGEIAYRKGEYTAAFESLRLAVDLDDGLGYSEPWSWMQPARHAYAALLLEQGHVEEAAAVYKSDLGLDSSVIRARRHLNNVWALHGYHECLIRLGKVDEAAVIEPQLTLALAVADVPVTSSCFCRTDVQAGETGCC